MDQETRNSETPDRRPWQAPRLTPLGSLASVTQAVGQIDNDGLSGLLPGDEGSV
jgi:hypothetical protein